MQLVLRAPNTHAESVFGIENNNHLIPNQIQSHIENAPVVINTFFAPVKLKP